MKTGVKLNHTADKSISLEWPKPQRLTIVAVTTSTTQIKDKLKHVKNPQQEFSNEKDQANIFQIIEQKCTTTDQL
jgi:hypothetical protein